MNEVITVDPNTIGNVNTALKFFDTKLIEWGCTTEIRWRSWHLKEKYMQSQIVIDLYFTFEDLSKS